MLAEIAVASAASDARGARDRRARRDLAAREDGALRPRRELGPHRRGRRLGEVQRRLRRSSIPTSSRSRSTACRCSSTGRPTGDEPALTNGHCAIEIDLALGDGFATYLTTDLSYDYVRSTRSTGRDRRPQGRRRVDGRRRGCSRGSLDGRRCASSTAPGRRSPRRWSGAASSCDFVGGRRVTTPGGARGRARELRRRQRRRMRRDRPARGRRSPATRSGSRRSRCRELGLVGDAAAVARRRRSSTRSTAGSCPSSRRSRAGPLNVNADEVASALAVGLGAARIRFLTDVPGRLPRRRLLAVDRGGRAPSRSSARRLRRRHRAEAARRRARARERRRRRRSASTAVVA